jgi:hypothetical protein
MFNRFFFPTLIISIWTQLYGFASFTGAQEPPSFMQTLASLSTLRDFSVDTGVYFMNQNHDKNKTLQEILFKYGLTEGTLWDQSKQTRINLLSTKKQISIPDIEVRKIHAAKYRIRIHNARGDFPLNFSESFHPNWRLYLVPWTFKEEKFDSIKTQKTLSSYQILKGNEKTQASLQSLKEFLKKRWVTDIELETPSSTSPYNFIKKIGRNKSDQTIPKTGFISKKFFNTIQNENLPTGAFWETWFSGNIDMSCKIKNQNKENCVRTNSDKWKIIKGFNSNVFEWPNALHWRINAQTNGWWVDSSFLRHPSLLKNNKPIFYRLNSNGTLSFELVMEFWPQRLFYIGGIISIIVLLLSLTLLFLRHIQRKLTPSIQ